MKRSKRFFQLFKKYKYFINKLVKFRCFKVNGDETFCINDSLKIAQRVSVSENDKRDYQFVDNISCEKNLFRGFSNRPKIVKYFSSLSKRMKAMVYILKYKINLGRFE
jgi:hypothetical protein